MTDDRRDEIDEVLSKYLPDHRASEGQPPTEATVVDGDVSDDDHGNPQDDSELLDDGMLTWVKTNLIFIFLAGFLVLSLVTLVFG